MLMPIAINEYSHLMYMFYHAMTTKTHSQHFLKCPYHFLTFTYLMNTKFIMQHIFHKMHAFFSLPRIHSNEFAIVWALFDFCGESLYHPKIAETQILLLRIYVGIQDDFYKPHSSSLFHLHYSNHTNQIVLTL